MDILLIIKAVIMGIVEGIAEFLPISSTGYLILSADMMNFLSGEFRNLFIVFIQLGAILAVIYDYWGRLWNAFIGLLTGKAEGLAKPRQPGLALIVATIPVMVMGFLFADVITEVLFHPLVVATMLIIGALLIIYAEKTPRKIIAIEAENISFKTALYIGLCQCRRSFQARAVRGQPSLGRCYLVHHARRRLSFRFSWAFL